MRPDIRRLTAAATLVSLIAVMGCTAGLNRPTLEEATKQLIADGDKLIASREVAASGKLAVTERAEKDTESGCIPGQVQRFFRAQGDLSGAPDVHMPYNSAGLMQSVLEFVGYDSVVNDRDLRDENLGLSVVRNSKTGLTFTLTVRNGQTPNIMIVGKTDCYARGG
ncbi:hypothetical protein [Nonomuraea antimicrobica]|uniref:hypothetical protein n=1 Tax=Nonomuraea antimicrobica TaxID=561173 RepID=UPI0031E6DC67